MPTSATGRRRSNYTLLELVAVLAILMTLLAVAAVQFRVETAENAPSRAAEKLRSLAALCRRQAAASGKRGELVFNPETRSVVSGSEHLKLGEALELFLNGSKVEAPTVLLRFFPDGSASEAKLTMMYENESATLQVLPLTGSIRIHEEE